jgi:MFS-type transporter involved in bile tolerance (Atg22 family)
LNFIHIDCSAQASAKGFMVIPLFRMLFYGIILAAIMTFMIGCWWAFSGLPIFLQLKSAHIAREREEKAETPEHDGYPRR